MKSPKAKIKEKKQNSNLISKIKATTRQNKREHLIVSMFEEKKVTIKRLLTIDYKNVKFKMPTKEKRI